MTEQQEEVDTSIFNSDLPDWFRKVKADTRRTVLIQSFEKDYVKYLYDFKKQFNSVKKEFANIPFNQTNTILKECIEAIIRLKPDTLNVNATADSSIVLRFSVNNKNFYLEIFFEEDEGIEVLAVLSVFKDRRITYSVDGTIKEMLSKINDINKKEHQEEYYPNYELSGSFITET